MDATSMLAKIRTFLDESSASFWTDTEIYAALAHGQISVIEFLFAVYQQRRKVDPNVELPDELRLLQNGDGAGITASRIAAPSGFMYLVNANWDHDASGSEEPCRILNMDRSFNHHIDNTFLAPSSTDPICYVAPTPGNVQGINFLPVYSANATYSIIYLKYPTAIASGQEPTLPESTHNAIVEYAVYAMLMKDQRSQEASQHYNLYLQELKTMLGV